MLFGQLPVDSIRERIRLSTVKTSLQSPPTESSTSSKDNLSTFLVKISKPQTSFESLLEEAAPQPNIINFQAKDVNAREASTAIDLGLTSLDALLVSRMKSESKNQTSNHASASFLSSGIVISVFSFPRVSVTNIKSSVLRDGVLSFGATMSLPNMQYVHTKPQDTGKKQNDKALPPLSFYSFYSTLQLFAAYHCHCR